MPPALDDQLMKAGMNRGPRARAGARLRHPAKIWNPSYRCRNITAKTHKTW